MHLAGFPGMDRRPDWAKVYDSTEEGGFRQSGLGRMNGLTVLDDFIEHKHIALKPGLLAR
jgi:betaine-aldehyde dehydrogenase